MGVLEIGDLDDINILGLGDVGTTTADQSETGKVEINIDFDPKVCSICSKKFDTVKRRNNHYATHQRKQFIQFDSKGLVFRSREAFKKCWDFMLTTNAKKRIPRYLKEDLGFKVQT